VSVRILMGLRVGCDVKIGNTCSSVMLSFWFRFNTTNLKISTFFRPSFDRYETSGDEIHAMISIRPGAIGCDQIACVKAFMSQETGLCRIDM
jgi:hypothetical protein